MVAEVLQVAHLLHHGQGEILGLIDHQDGGLALFAAEVAEERLELLAHPAARGTGHDAEVLKRTGVELARREAGVGEVQKGLALAVEAVGEQAQGCGFARANLAGHEGEALAGEGEAQAGEELLEARPAVELLWLGSFGERQPAEAELRERGGQAHGVPSFCEAWVKRTRPAARLRTCSSWRCISSWKGVRSWA